MAKQPPLAQHVIPVEIPCEKHAPARQYNLSTTGSQNWYADRPDSAEQHAFLTSSGITVGSSFRLNIAGEDQFLTREVKQTALLEQSAAATAASPPSKGRFELPLFHEAVVEQSPLTEQHPPDEDPTRRQGLYAGGAESVGFEQHAFVKATNTVMDSDFCFNMDAEDLPKGITKQVAFNDASGMRLAGGFFGMGSGSVVRQIAENQLKRQMAQDAFRFRLEMEQLALDRDIELNKRVQQREKMYAMDKGPITE